MEGWRSGATHAMLRCASTSHVLQARQSDRPPRMQVHTVPEAKNDKLLRHQLPGDAAMLKCIAAPPAICSLYNLLGIGPACAQRGAYIEQARTVCCQLLSAAFCISLVCT